MQNDYLIMAAPLYCTKFGSALIPTSKGLEGCLSILRRIPYVIKKMP